MCGIAGYYNNFNDPSLNSFELNHKIIKSIEHRGPDYNNFWTDNFLHLIHTRLSIIDISEKSNQPMLSQSGRYVLIYNGELYNFKYLKSNFLKDINLKTTGDTEVILNLFEKYGISNYSISLLNGMFAIAIYDKKNKELFLIRDKTGQKPIYFYHNNNNFAFSSDLLTFYNFHKFDLSLNFKLFQEYMYLGYFPGSTTPFNHIYKVLPGQFLKIKNNNKKIEIKKRKWWDEKKIINNNKKFFSLKSFDDLFETVIRDNSISDVNSGIFLSSGIDSTLIASYANRISDNNINTFTIGFNNKNYDESYHAEKIALKLKSNHNTIKINHDDVSNALKEMSKVFTEPFSDSSQIPTFLLTKFASKKIKMALSGDGADELFGGYNRYRYLPYVKFLQIIKLNKVLNLNFLSNKYINIFLKKYIQILDEKIKKIKLLNNKKYTDDYSLYKLTLNNNNFDKVKNLLLLSSNKNILPKNSLIWSSKLDFKEKMMINDFLNYLPDDLLVKTDRASMYHSMEVRSPFLDDRVINCAFNMERSQKINYLNNNKAILRNILNKYFDINIQSSKKGFAIPLQEFFKNDLFQWIKELLNRDKVIQQGIFDYSIISKIIYEITDKQIDHSKILLNIVSIQNFIDEHEKKINNSR